jgi:hypothetical protein
MKRIEFTQEFYKEVYNKIMDKQSSYDEGEGFDFYPTIYVEFNGVRYQIDIEVTYASEFRDESFDHAFGTWHDPNAGYYFADGIDDIGNVDVWDDEDDEEVEGFDKEAFWQQFDKDRYRNIKVGDKVVYFDKEYEFVVYNYMQERAVLKDADGCIKKAIADKMKKVA